MALKQVLASSQVIYGSLSLSSSNPPRFKRLFRLRSLHGTEKLFLKFSLKNILKLLHRSYVGEVCKRV